MHLSPYNSFFLRIQERCDALLVIYLYKLKEKSVHTRISITSMVAKICNIFFLFS
jgi:hypothetical protein